MFLRIYTIVSLPSLHIYQRDSRHNFVYCVVVHIIFFTHTSDIFIIFLVNISRQLLVRHLDCYIFTHCDTYLRCWFWLQNIQGDVYGYYNLGQSAFYIIMFLYRSCTMTLPCCYTQVYITDTHLITVFYFQKCRFFQKDRYLGCDHYIVRTSHYLYSSNCILYVVSYTLFFT